MVTGTPPCLSLKKKSTNTATSNAETQRKQRTQRKAKRGDASNMLSDGNQDFCSGSSVFSASSALLCVSALALEVEMEVEVEVDLAPRPPRHEHQPLEQMHVLLILQ